MSWDENDRRKGDENTAVMLARIDERTQRMEVALFGQNGLEGRLRHVEQDNAATKAKSGVIAVVVSFVVTGIGWFLGKH